MAKFNYINKAGQTAQTEAVDAASALKLAPDIAPDSGVQAVPQAVQQTTTEQRGITSKNNAYIDSKLQAGQNSTLSPEMEKYFRENPSALNGKPLDPNKPTPTNTQGGTGTGNTTNTTQAQTTFDTSTEEGLLKKKAQDRIDEATTTLTNLKATSNVATAKLIDSINKIYGARIRKMEDSNMRLLETTRATGIRQGRGRYSPMMQQGVLSAEEERGHDRVAELEGAMLQAIAKAESDRASGDLASFNAAADRVDKIEASLNKEIMDLHKRAIETDKAIRDKAKAEQDATKQDFEMQLKKAETAAPALVNALSEFTTEEQKLKFLDSYSKKSGIETDILLGEIELASQKSEKANLDLENIRNTIQNRNSSTGLQYAKFNQETDEKQTKTVLTQRILEKLLAKTLTKDQALDVWVTGGGTIAEFTKEFAEYI